jgi:tripartite-type tricarboxylate transporter receptor subunit TctC
VPTSAESGLSGFEASAWFGLVGPRGLPAEIVARLHGEVQKILATKELRDVLSNLGTDAGGNTPEQFTALIGSDAEKWARAVKASGAKID